MIRLAAATAVLALATGVAAQEERPKIDRALLERFRKLTPEQKERLRERLRVLENMSPEERRRLKANLEHFRALPKEKQAKLRERFESLSPAERREAIDLASGFFRWTLRRLDVEDFPRQPFFRWVWTHHREKLEELKGLDEGRRKDEFLKLAHGFRLYQIAHLEAHVRRHRCAAPEDVKALRDLDFREFWVQSLRLMSSCPARKPAPPRRR